MMSIEGNLVKAIYSFKGKNNDELCFKKGEIITVTQREEGGWWEGTLGDTTGWFPSNYVTEHKESSGSVTTSPVRAPSEIQAFRNVVLKDIIDSEKAHVGELQGLVTNFLQPLEESDILTRDEFRQLTGNINEVLLTHQQLLALIQECGTNVGPEQRVGGLFLQWAPQLKSVHQTYCAGHPRAVCILDKFKDELNTFMEQCGAVCPGLLVLTAGLSKPFRRLNKYAAMLQELGRHVHEAHPDRGDTHRAVEVYKDVATTCAALRRQKELELQVVTGTVRGWQGGDLSSTLGEVLHMGGVAVGQKHADRYFVLFPTSLLILSVSKRMSAFVYEGCLPLTGISVCKLDDTDTRKNAFEISGAMIDSIVAVCQTRAEADNWVTLLQKHCNVGNNISFDESHQPHSLPHILPTSMDNSLNASGTNHKRSHSFNNHHSYMQYVQQIQQIQQNQQRNKSSHWLLHSCDSLSQNSVKFKDSSMVPKFSSIDFIDTSSQNTSTKGWSITSLRPAPPLRPQSLNSGSSDEMPGSMHPYAPHQRKVNSYEEDALILRVIEAYCTSARCRNAVSSVDLGHLSRGNVQTNAHITNNVHCNNIVSPAHRSVDLDVCYAQYCGSGAKVKRNNTSGAVDAFRLHRVPENKRLLSDRKFKLNRSNPSLAERVEWAGDARRETRRGGSSSPPVRSEDKRSGSHPALLPVIDTLPRGTRSSTWCCGNFVKQLRKSHHFD